MNNSNPKVSILMNCHNGEKYIKSSINSIFDQTYKNWELIFFDNCSTDNTRSIIKSYCDDRIKYYYSHKFLTLGQARRTAEIYLSGEYIAILDSDDLWEKEKLSIQVDLLNRNQDVSFVFSAVKYFNSNKHRNYFPYNKFIKQNLFSEFLKNYQITLVSVLINKKSIQKLGLFFDDTYNYITDFDLFLRLSRDSNVIYIPKITASWRLHEKNETIKNPFYFVDEKNIWLKNNKKHINKIEHNFYNYLLLKNNLERARISLNIHGRINALKIIFSYKNISFKILYNILFIILPFSRYYIIKRHKKNL